MACGLSNNLDEQGQGLKNYDSQSILLNHSEIDVTIEYILKSDSISMDKFVKVCSDSLIGSYFLLKVVDNYFEKGGLFISKEDFKLSGFNINSLFNKEEKREILNHLKASDLKEELFSNISFEYGEDDEFESTKIYLFVKNNNKWLFKGILIAG